MKLDFPTTTTEARTIYYICKRERGREREKERKVEENKGDI
jgi:hypothetical protein